MSSSSDTPARGPLQAFGVFLDRLEKTVICLFLVVIVGLIFSGVLSRFIFHYAIAFTEELARFMFVWSALLGASAALRTGEHGGIPLLANRFGPAGRKAVEILVALGVIGFMAYLVFMTGVSTMKSFQSGQISTTTEMPVWIINFGMLLAFVMGVLRGIQGFLAGAFRPSAGAEIDIDADVNADVEAGGKG
ncbi:MAG: TRAP transporter small permease [Hyphomicrobiales bacterium]|nr:TRAP transporter small permease [Hyphomicrobiales bacterium]